MLKNIFRQSFSKSPSVRELQDHSKAGWSKRQRFIAWAIMGAIGLKLYSTYYKTDLLYTFAPTKQNISAINNCPSLRTGKYYPTFYLPSALMQAIYGSIFDPIPYIPMTREQLLVDEQGGSINLDYLPVHNKFIDAEGQSKNNMRVLVILHGLTGASESNYIRQTALHASRKGFRTICVNLRGFALTKLTSPKLTDYSDINDVQIAIQHVYNQYPQANLYLLGYSMGSNLMLRYLEQDKDNRVTAAVGISVPWDLQELSESISKYTKIIYDFGVTRNFKRNLKWNLDVFNTVKDQHNLDLDGALKCYKSKQFDELFTMRLFNHSSTQELYSKIECKTTVSKLHTPILLLSSLNDPLITQSMIPKDQIKANPYLMLIQTQSGGHIEWFTGYRPIRWIIKPAIEYLEHSDKQKIS